MNDARALVAATAVAVVAAPLLSGCAGSTQASSAEAVKVQMLDGGFQPATLVVPRGTEVRWTNQDPVAHTVTTADVLVAGEPAVPAAVEPWDSGPLAEGETFAHRFQTTGTYVYWSEGRPDREMVGVVRVEAR